MRFQSLMHIAPVCLRCVLSTAVVVAVVAAASDGGSAAAASSAPGAQCSSVFHVWQPDQDAQQRIQDVYLKMDNLTSYARAELFQMKAHIAEELSRVHNWTNAVDRRVFQIQIDRMDDEMIQMKFSSSSAKVKMQLDRVNRRVSDLERSLYGVENKLRSWTGTGSESSNQAKSPLTQPRQAQHQGVLQDMGHVLRNSVSDLKAEWILLKRDIEALKKRTSTLVTRQTELHNDTVSLKLSLSGTDASTRRLQTRFLTLADHQDQLESKLEEVNAETTDIKRDLEEYRLDTVQGRAKVIALQARVLALERDFSKVLDQPADPTQETVPSWRREDIRETAQAVGEMEEGQEEAGEEEDLRHMKSGGKKTGGGHVQAGGSHVRVVTQYDRYPTDCQEVYLRGFQVSSVYHIKVDGSRYIMPVYCEMINNTGYTLIQRRVDGTLGFNRGWSEYKQGFGNPYGELWAGNELVHLLSAQRKYTLRIDFWDWDGEQYFAEYSRFYVEEEKDHYRLHVGGFTGTAGDSLSYHNMMAFSTEDMDNDLHERHCAAENKGGWWYGSCFYSQLNGLYHTAWYSQTKFADGIVWYTLKDNEFYSLKKVEMKLKPQQM